MTATWPAVSRPTSRWFPFGGALPFRTGPDAARVTLYTLPHAGAGASAFRAWGAGLPPHIAVCPVQPPGRETRLGEDPYLEIGPLVRDLTADLLDAVTGPYAVLGHSVGALVAFELVREIRRRGGRPPVHLFVAGCPAPDLPDIRPPMRHMDAGELAAMLRSFGGTPEAMLSDRRLLEIIAPLFRADFSVKETYRHVAEAPLDVPVTAFCGTVDPRAEPDEMRAWHRHSAAGFRLHLLSGGHFALLDQQRLVHGHITAALSPVP